MSERPAVGIVVVNYNSAAFIDEFCETLRRVEYERWSLRVVDSGSDDGSADVIERAFPDADIVRCGDNVGFAAGCNVGVGLCREHGDEYVLFLNNDVSLTPGFLDRLVDAADWHTIVVPKILFRDDPRLISTHAGGFDWRLGLFRHTYHGKPDGPATSRRRDGLETASFCCALVPLAAFDAAGMLDERFFMYYEETDWLRRARSHGYRIRYEPSAVIYHRESGSSGGGWMTPFKMYYATRNRMYLVRKNAASRRDVAVFTAYFFATRLPSLASLAVRRHWRLMRAMLLGIRDYYAGRMGRTMQVQDL